MGKLIRFVKGEVVLVVSLALAMISMLFVHPDSKYSSYIDYRTLSILLSLMFVMAGLQALQVFRQIGEFLVAKMRSARGVAIVLVALCFFASMFITNDVSLITFVPFTIVTLRIANRFDLLIQIIVLETIAANLGSMATPIGNPQNLYLFSLSGLSITKFLALMLPYTLCAAVLLVLAICVKINREPLQAKQLTSIVRSRKDRLKICLYILCFLVSLLVVVRILDYRIGLLFVLAVVILTDFRQLVRVDYSLIFTFVFLFVFIGNMKRIPEISQLLSLLVSGHEVPVSILFSQVISNVPTAILCSGFTDNISGLIVGTNLGGLGTLIASMASLISYKQYVSVQDARPGKYLVEFTVWNLLFLAAMAALYLLSCFL